MRRYRKGGIDKLYVEHALDGEPITLGWAETATGEITVQVPGAEARVDVALENWARHFPADDLATHTPGRHVSGMAAAWQREVEDIDADLTQLAALRDMAAYQRDQYRKGAAGETRIGNLLNSLYPHGWGLLHSIPTWDGQGDIDHLLIGPGGVWTVNSKKHPDVDIAVNGDTMRVGRVRVDYVRSARIEAQSVARTLAKHGAPCEVFGMVLLDIPRASRLKVWSPPEGVLVEFWKDAPPLLRAQPARLNQAQINHIYGVARRRQTWEA